MLTRRTFSALALASAALPSTTAASAAESAAPDVAALVEVIRPPEAGQPLSHEWQVRQALIGSQLMGLAFQRYIMGAQPVATADPDQLAAWVGPVIDRYLHEPLEGDG